ncbi:MAG: hypothetical protein KY437_05245 [Actinobacteria bacterium]|nr:hypothetical protein [Actinomycetota bacterium]
MRTVRHLLAAVVALACVAFVNPAATTVATPGSDPIETFLNDCPRYDEEQRICTGQVPSFDGAQLDVDLTLPMRDSRGPQPLIVMLHGFGNDKHEWQSLDDEGDGRDKWHWNSHWFARHGFYVLTYTARGFDSEQDGEAYAPETPAGTSDTLPSGTIQLKSREVEIRDTQWLAAQVARSFDVDPHRIAVTGGSYGGGESWLQASEARWTSPNEQDPALPVLDLQVAVPKYPWTDLAYSLAPHGHPGGPAGDDHHESSFGRPDSETGSGYPVGVVKESYTSGFYALGNTEGTFEAGSRTTPTKEGQYSTHVWYDRAAVVGEPYDVAGAEDPTVAQIRRGLTEFRSAYYQQEDWQAQAEARPVAVFSIQGWTDDIFPAVESLRMFEYLKRLDPMWPVEVFLGDVGHPRAQNPKKTWERANHAAWRFLQAHLAGSHRQITGITSEPTVCPPDSGQQQPAAHENARTPDELGNGSLTVRYAQGDTQTHLSGIDDPNGPATDPVLGSTLAGQPGACRVSPGPSTAYTATSQPLPEPRTYIGLGTVTVPYTLTGTSATLNARVWDVAPDGTARLVTRGTYRFSVPAYDGTSGTIELPLWGNHWRLEAGHRIRLDLAGVDAPTMRPSTAPFTLAFGPPSLELPVRDATTTGLTGS